MSLNWIQRPKIAGNFIIANIKKQNSWCIFKIHATRESVVVINDIGLLPKNSLNRSAFIKKLITS